MRIHYLGHASFVLRLENGQSILMDYGVSNAYGLASPVFDVSGAEPSVVTYSHDHPDHRRPGTEFRKSRILAGGGDVTLDGLTIRSILTSESSIGDLDNASFVVSYGGFKILHLADAQAYISAIDDPVVKHKVKARYPDNYDLVLMTIDGPSEMIAQAATFLDLLAPARAIPMHYWSPGTKADFLAEMLRLNGRSRGREDRFTVAEPGGSDFSLYADSPPFSTKVISLEPSPLCLCPDDSRPLHLQADAGARPAAPAEPAPSTRRRAAAPGPLSTLGPGAGPWRRPVPGSSSPRSPAAAPTPIHGYAAAVPMTPRRSGPGLLSTRGQSSVTTRGGRGLD